MHYQELMSRRCASYRKIHRASAVDIVDVVDIVATPYGLAVNAIFFLACRWRGLYFDVTRRIM